MTLQQLEYIIALDTYRHYVTAAEKCFVTQPTITTQVKKLEDEIGFQIFDRSKTPLEPTPGGTLILTKARLIVQEVKQLKAMVNSERESLDGHFKIGIIPTISPYLVPRFTGSFSNEYPGTRLQITEMQSAEILSSIEKGMIDIGIMVTPADESFVREIPLYNEPFVYYGQSDSPLKKKAPLKPKDVRKLEGLRLLNSGHCFRSQVLSMCEPDKSSIGIDFQSGSIETLKEMVDKYGGFTLIPEMSVREHESNKVLAFSDPKPIREVSLVVHKSFVKEALIDALRKEILNVVPKNFEKNERFIKVKWR